MRERHRRLFFLTMFALVFYLVGASFVESFVTYPTWRLVGRNEFPDYYHELASRIVRTVVRPGVLEIAFTVTLLWLRPRVIPRWALVTVLLLNIVRFVSTAIGQTRVQEELRAETFSQETINGLVRLDYLTQAVSSARALLYLWMTSLVVGEKAPAGPAAGPVTGL